MHTHKLKMAAKNDPTGPCTYWPVELPPSTSSDLAVAKGLRRKSEILEPWTPEGYFVVSVQSLNHQGGRVFHD